MQGNALLLQPGVYRQTPRLCPQAWMVGPHCSSRRQEDRGNHSMFLDVNIFITALPEWRPWSRSHPYWMFMTYSQREGLKKNTATYPLLVDRRLTPLPPLSTSAKLIIFTLRNFFIHRGWPPPHGPYPPLLKINNIFFLISIHPLFFLFLFCYGKI